jgi:transposase
MRSKVERHSEDAEKAVRDIPCATRRQYSAEEKVRIVIAGLRGEDSIAELCRKEGINQNLYHRWSKDFQKLGQRLSILVARIHRDELTRVFKNDEIPLAVAIFGFARLADL